MRFSRPKPKTRLYLCGALLVTLLAVPLAAGLSRPESMRHGLPDPIAICVAGLAGVGDMGVAAMALALVFALWLVLGEQRIVNLRMLNQRARDRQNFINGGRLLLVVFGAAGIIASGLMTIHAGLVALRPDLAAYAAPHFTFLTAVVCFLLGISAYTLGRAGR
ncbi:MAG: hypothetical protein GC155_11660 [Alphaproteobacteria bacterium]|nr:hypothetical protein [Alphaproteobacteria bacterium]